MKRLIALFAALVLLSGCGNNESVDPDAVRALTNPPAERQQMLDIEDWKDTRGQSPVFLYVVNIQGELLLSATCRGVPTSSTESPEPNNAHSDGFTSYNDYGFRVPNSDGRRMYSTEQMGRDGTYGDPVPYRQCLTPEGRYLDVPPQMAIVSSVPLTFPSAGVAVDAALEARRLQAEQAVKEGKCLNDDLSIRPCDQRDAPATDSTEPK